jgi:integrase
LTRGDAAKLIWICWRYRETQRMSRGQMKGLMVPTGKRPLRHLARFILLGIYSGSRAGAIAAASPIPAVGRSYVDLERGRYYRRKQGTSVKTAFKSAVRLAKLGPGISPHTLRHTAATWLMQRGADPWQAAGYLGMSLEVLLNTYGHHHPDYLSDAVERIAMREPTGERKAHVSGAGFGAVIPLRRNSS